MAHHQAMAAIAPDTSSHSTGVRIVAPVVTRHENHNVTTLYVFISDSRELAEYRDRATVGATPAISCVIGYFEFNTPRAQRLHHRRFHLWKWNHRADAGEQQLPPTSSEKPFMRSVCIRRFVGRLFPQPPLEPRRRVRLLTGDSGYATVCENVECSSDLKHLRMFGF